MNRQERQERQEPSAAADAIARQVVDAGLKVHRTLGPGLLESVYEACLTHELVLRGLSVRRQVPLPLEYEGLLVNFNVVLFKDGARRLLG